MTPIEEQLTEYGMWQRDRDQLVLTAYNSGVSQRRIAALTGLARMTVRSILSASVLHDGDDDSGYSCEP